MNKCRRAEWCYNFEIRDLDDPSNQSTTVLQIAAVVIKNKVLQAFMWTMRHVQFVLFTTKLTKGSDILNSELRALGITIVKNLRGLRK